MTNTLFQQNYPEMRLPWRSFGLAIALFLNLPAIEAAQPVCSANTTPVVTRMEGKTEPVADIVLTCSGGAPTLANQPVPQVDINVFLNTTITSHITANSEFNEALLLVDEPNTLPPPQHPLLNCGQLGAYDNGIRGPGVCEIISDGDPTHTYDGTQFVKGARTCPAGVIYGCGRPNAFQGRINGASNVITFLGVPFDSPGAGVRRLRITNLRANAAALGAATIYASISITGQIAISIPNPVQVVGFNVPALSASTATLGIVRVTEGFSAAWKDRSIAFTVGNPPPGNANLGTFWAFNGNKLYPASLAQNVPGVSYNTEDLFQWQNDAPNGPPSPNPPVTFNAIPVVNIGMPFKSLGFGGVLTNIEDDGVASHGTRIALEFSGVPPGLHVACATSVLLHSNGPNPTGVLVMTVTDSQGAGAYTPVSSALGTSAPGLAVYEVLYADPHALEFADIPCFLVNGANAKLPPANVTVRPQLAPFYSSVSSGHPTPTFQDPTPTDLPRFAAGSITLTLTTGF